jgi:hypothetical protein
MTHGENQAEQARQPPPRAEGPVRRFDRRTGSHINNTFLDGAGPDSDCAESPEQFDYDAYLKFLKDHGHNFIRLWRWEHFRSQLAGGKFHM